jgi:hypothetical protein
MCVTPRHLAHPNIVQQLKEQSPLKFSYKQTLRAVELAAGNAQMPRAIPGQSEPEECQADTARRKFKLSKTFEERE